MRILLTGATGLIGQTVRLVLAEKHDLITFGRGPGSDIVADFSQPDMITAAALPMIDALVHCAGVVDEDFRDDPGRAIRMALFGADALARGAVEAGAKRLVYLSSAHVYGPMIGCIDENSAINPVSDYAIAHFAAEQAFRRQVTAGVAALALRPCAVFGDLKSPSSFRRWSLIPFSFPLNAMNDHAIVIRSSGEQRRDFVGSEDIARTLRNWLDADAQGWSVINPVGRTSSSVHEFALLCARISEEITGIPCPIRREEADGPTPGADFDFRSISGLTVSEQPLDAFVRRLCLQLAAA
jgi:UDP-glucose 4-epimerase